MAPHEGKLRQPENICCLVACTLDLGSPHTSRGYINSKHEAGTAFEPREDVACPSDRPT